MLRSDIRAVNVARSDKQRSKTRIHRAEEMDKVA